MKPILFLSLICFLLVSCTADDTITLRGDIRNLKTNKIFLSPVYPVGAPPLDSAEVVEGKFEFTIKPDTAFIADFIRLSYKDTLNKFKSLAVSNPYRKKSNFADFILEPGVTSLTGDAKSSEINLEGGKQNEFYFKNSELPYIRISGDSTKAEAQAKRIIKLIKEHPDAYWALFAINNLQFQFNHTQLTDIYNAFSSDTQSSYKGRMLKRFLDFQPKSKSDFLHSAFWDITSKESSVMDTSKKLNMVVFWASWCGPCRREIPSLKRIYSKQPKNNFRIVSISIDTDREAWLEAMKQEKMPWQQLLVQPAEIEASRAKYNLGWVPQIYLVNNRNKVVKKIDGFDESNEGEIQGFISNYLAKN